ncbi:crotonase/enoyl-CoA hydratase family protein [Solimonas marina]|uniref:Crotonase/enoyl-CoA hydratase family protein n=1 Tax=Solimonas marina TaxID=2714601 RepID=A0A970B7L3_9GAMM|nr:crotonase/enoyl-CoA hydratase family protein [Solimonas marina]NKF24023.1 crotonase/enoyl-CoA hydratase family protein [Solimonas marina]
MQQEFHGRVRLQIDDGIARVTLIRGDRHNGVDIPMLQGMLAAQRALRRRRDVRCAIIAGDGPSFCAGLDFKSVLRNKLPALLLYLRLYSPVANMFQRFSVGWRQLPFPVIAAIHGNCFGAGIQLALGADVRIATADAQLSIMESKWGLVPDMGGTVLLRDVVSLDVAKELTFTSRIVSGADAAALGLVTHVADDPLDAAAALAAEIATRSPDAVAAGKFLLQRSWQASPWGALALERRYQRKVMMRKNQRISVARQQRGGEAKPFAARELKR